MAKKSQASIAICLLLTGGAVFVNLGTASIEESILWTANESGTDFDLNGVVWGGDKFVVVGDRGAMATSPDGVIWTERASGTSKNLHDVTWNGQRFVAVGQDVVLSSDDGEIWQFRASVGGGSLSAVAYGSGRFVAVGRQSLSSVGLMMISVDGIFWDTYKIPDYPLLDIYWDGVHFYRSSVDYIERSTDAQGWVVVLERTAADFRGVVRGHEGLIAVGSDVSCSSSDGAAWVCLGNTLGDLHDVITSGHRYFACGNEVYSSEDGMSWISSSTGDFNASFGWSLGAVIVGDGGGVLLGDTSLIFADGFESGNANDWSQIVPSPTPTPTPSCSVSVYDMRSKLSYPASSNYVGATITNDHAATATITRIFWDWGANMSREAYNDWMRICTTGSDNHPCQSSSANVWDYGGGDSMAVPPTGRFARPLDVAGPPYLGMYNNPQSAQIGAGVTTHWWANIKDGWMTVVLDGTYTVCFDFMIPGEGPSGGDLVCSNVCAEIHE